MVRRIKLASRSEAGFIRRLAVLTVLWVVMVLPGFVSDAQAAQPRTLVMLPFGLIDSLQEIVPFPDKADKLQMITADLATAFRDEQLYTVLESPEITAMIAEQQQRYDLHDCNSCELDIAAAAGADRVLIAWVQRATALILNVNIEIRDGRTGSTVLRKSVEIRGNTDANWRRAVRSIVRNMVSRGQGNR